MPIFEIDPLLDPRWATFVSSDSRSSIFHTTEWLESLRRTYRYASKVFTLTPANAPLTGGIVFSQVNSWLTGSRLVSLPFSDHCEPLVQDPEELRELLDEIPRNATGRFKYLEIRPRLTDLGSKSAFRRYSEYYLHVLDLDVGAEILYSRLHKDSVQRKIRRADNEHVELVQGRSELLLRQFYSLLLLTRRRHRLPPQPLAWFRNLADCFGANLTVRLARANGQPIASILTLRHKKTVVYKYGCSDARFHKLGAMPRLFWQLIEQASSENLQEIDFGRSEKDNPGLIRFKDHLGARKVPLSYWRFSLENKVRRSRGYYSKLAQSVLSHLPDPMFRLAGKVFYRHAG